MSDIQDYIDAQHLNNTSQTFETAMFLQNPLPNLSLTGLLAQHRQQNLEFRMLQRSRGPGSLPQAIPRPTHTSPSTTPTSTASTTPNQQAYHHSNALYSRMHLRLTLLIIELTEETRRHRNHNTPQPRDPLVSIFEKEQEIAALLERLDAIAHGVQDLSEGEDGVWGPAAGLEMDGDGREDGDDDDEAAAGSSEAEEWSSGRLSDDEVDEAVAEAWREVYSELELCRYPGMYRETGD